MGPSILGGPTKIIINRLEIAHNAIQTRARFQAKLGTRVFFTNSEKEINFT